MIWSYLLTGVSLDGWAEMINPTLTNELMEVFTETYIIIGMTALSPIIAFLFFWRGSIFSTSLFMLFDQQFSDDLNEIRYVILFSLIRAFRVRASS